MKYFNPSYWFKLWVLSAPLFNDKTQGINAKSIDNKKIQDWASNNTSSLESINQEISYTNSSNNYQPYNLNQVTKQNINPIYQTELEISTHKHKRSFDAKEQIEFLNNNFFYKFNINYDTGKIEGPISNGFDAKVSNSLLIKNWTKYAKNWSEFEEKFPEIEILNLRSELGGQGDTVKTNNNFKIKTLLKNNNLQFTYSYKNREIIWNNLWNSDLAEGIMSESFMSNYNLEDYNLIQINHYNYVLSNFAGNWAKQDCKIFIRLVATNEELKLQIFFRLESLTAIYKTFGSLKFDCIRLIGKVDMNPLISIMIEKGQTIENWYNSVKIELNRKKEDISYNKQQLLDEENIFYNDFIDKLTQWKIDYVQNLILIEHDYKILKLNEEISEINERLNNLEKSKTCVRKIVETFKTKSTVSPSDKFIDTIADNKAIKEIFIATEKAFATTLIKGPLNAVLGCLVESIVSRKKEKLMIIIN